MKPAIHLHNFQIDPLLSYLREMGSLQYHTAAAVLPFVVIILTATITNASPFNIPALFAAMGVSLDDSQFFGNLALASLMLFILQATIGFYCTNLILTGRPSIYVGISIRRQLYFSAFFSISLTVLNAVFYFTATSTWLLLVSFYLLSHNIILIAYFYNYCADNCDKIITPLS